MPDVAFVALGSNLGDRESHLAFGRHQLGQLPTTRILAASDVDETAPLGGLRQPHYLNQMVAIATSLEPRDLLGHLHEIEAARGRQRGARGDSRTLDLDIVTYGDVLLDDPDLTIPHPGLRNRIFWQRQTAVLRQMLATRA